MWLKQVFVSILDIWYASDVMGYGRRIPELFYAALNMNQDTTNKEKKTATP